MLLPLSSWNHLHYIYVIVAITFFPITGIVSWDLIEGGQYNGGVIFVPSEENNFYFLHDESNDDVSDDYGPIVPREDPELETGSVPIILAEYFDDFISYEQPESEQPQYGEIAPVFDADTEIQHAVPAERSRKEIDNYKGRKDTDDNVEDDWGLDKDDYKEDDDDDDGYGWDSSISHADAFGYSKRFYKLKSYKVRKGSIFDRTKKKYAYNPGHWDYHASKSYAVHKYAHHPLDKYKYIYEKEKYQKFNHPLDKYDSHGWGSGSKDFEFTKGKYHELKNFFKAYNRYYYGW